MDSRAESIAPSFSRQTRLPCSNIQCPHGYGSARLHVARSVASSLSRRTTLTVDLDGNVCCNADLLLRHVMPCYFMGIESTTDIMAFNFCFDQSGSTLVSNCALLINLLRLTLILDLVGLRTCSLSCYLSLLELGTTKSKLSSAIVHFPIQLGLYYEF